MNLKVIRFLSICYLLFVSINLLAQDDYRSEIGINGGGSYYLGDANTELFKNTTLTYGALFRYKLNSRIAFRAEWNKISVENPALPKSNNVNTLDACGEFNFFDLENNPNKKSSKTFSPYIFTGIGVAHFNYLNGGTYSIGIPFGIGIKVKLGNRWNLNTQWSNRLYFSDKIEGVSNFDNPNNLNGNNILNNDLISSLTIGISYNIWRKSCDCIKNKNN